MEIEEIDYDLEAVKASNPVGVEVEGLEEKQLISQETVMESLFSESEIKRMKDRKQRGGRFKPFEFTKEDLLPPTDVMVERANLRTLVEEISDELAQDSWYFSEETGKSYSFSELMRRRKDMTAVLGKSAGNRVFSDYIKSLPRLAGFSPNVPKIPKAGGMGKDAIDDNIQKSGIFIISGKAMIRQPKLEEIPDFMPDYEVFRGGDQKLSPHWLPVSNVFPDISFFLKGQNKWNSRYPAYLPTYDYAEFDKEIMSTIAMLATNYAEDPVIGEAFKKLAHDAKVTVHNNFYGGGTLQGQLGRHKSCLEIVDTINNWQNQKGVTQLKVPKDFAKYVELMDKRYPLKKVKANLANPPTEVLSKYETSTDPNKNPIFTAIDGTADAGIVWGMAKRAQVAPQDLYFSDFMFEVCKSYGLDFSTPAKTDEFWKYFSWLKLTKMKNKSECYEAEDMYKKTRNIFVMNSCGQVVPQMILKPTRYKTLTFEDSPEVWSMIGWNPFRGGMDRLMKSILIKKKGFRIVYADNVYVVADVEGKPTFLSLDSSKAEASIPVELVQFETERSLLYYDRVDKFYENYARHIHPNLAVGGIAVLGDNQIPTPYLGSGAQGTAYYNTAKMIMFLDHWLTLSGGKEVNLKLMDKVQKEIGAVMKVESKVPLSEFTEGKYLKVDVLGFDSVNLKKFFDIDAFVPVLSYERLLKSLMWFKSGKRIQKKYSPDIFAFIKLCRLRALYMLGGWFYPGVDMTIQKICRQILFEWKFNDRIQLSVEEFKEEVGSFLQESTDMDEDTSMTLATITQRTEVPSVFDMIEFLVGTDEAFVYAVNMSKDKQFKGMLSNLIPLSVYKELKSLDKSLPEPEYAIVHDVSYDKPTGMTVRLAKMPFADYLRDYGRTQIAIYDNQVLLKESLVQPLEGADPELSKVRKMEEDWAFNNPDIEESGSKPVIHPAKGRQGVDQTKLGTPISKTPKPETQPSSIPVAVKYSQENEATPDMMTYVRGQLIQHLGDLKEIIVTLNLRDKKLKYSASKVAMRIIADKLKVPVAAVSPVFTDVLKGVKFKEGDSGSFVLNAYKKFKPFS